MLLHILLSSPYSFHLGGLFCKLQNFMTVTSFPKPYIKADINCIYTFSTRAWCIIVCCSVTLCITPYVTGLEFTLLFSKLRPSSEVVWGIQLSTPAYSSSSFHVHIIEHLPSLQPCVLRPPVFVYACSAIAFSLRSSCFLLASPGILKTCSTDWHSVAFRGLLPSSCATVHWTILHCIISISLFNKTAVKRLWKFLSRDSGNAFPFLQWRLWLITTKSNPSGFHCISPASESGGLRPQTNNSLIHYTRGKQALPKSNGQNICNFIIKGDFLSLLYIWILKNGP